MEKEESPIFMKHTLEYGMEEYKKVVDQFEDLFFDLEKTEPIDFSEIYMILPVESKLKKKTLLWGFSLAKKCNSKIYIAVKKTPKTEEEVRKLSNVMNVEFEFLDGDIHSILNRIKHDTNIVVLPRDIIEGSIRNEKHKGPLLII